MHPAAASAAPAYFVSPYTQYSIPAIKFAALYFDRIVLQQNLVQTIAPEQISSGPAAGSRALLKMIDRPFLDSVAPLMREGLLTVRDATARPHDTATVAAVRDVLRGLLSQRPDLIAPESATGRLNEIGEFLPGLHVLGEYIPSYIEPQHEVRAVVEKHFGTFTVGRTFPLDFMYAYYGTLLAESLCLMAEGQFALSGSAVLDSCMQYVLQHDSVVGGWAAAAPVGSFTPKVAHELLAVTLPDVSELSFDDLLDARYRLGPELKRLQSEVSRLSHSLANEHDPSRLLASLPDEVNAHIVPAVDALKANIAASKHKVLADLAASLPSAEPIPWLTFLLPSLPVYLAVIASLAATAAGPIVDYIGRQGGLARNGLFGLIRLDRQLRK